MKRIQSPFARKGKQFSRADTDGLRIGLGRREREAIYENGRRQAREFEPTLRKLSTAPDWTPGKPPSRHNFEESLDFLRRTKFYEARIASLAVLAKWGDGKSETELIRGASIMTDLESLFIPALGFAYTTETVNAIERLPAHLKGFWKCTPAYGHELECRWQGLEPSRTALIVGSKDEKSH